MRSLVAILRELLGLFVGDAGLAVGILAIVAAVALLIRTATLVPLHGGYLLVVALVALLATTVVRAARR